MQAEVMRFDSGSNVTPMKKLSSGADKVKVA